MQFFNEGILGVIELFQDGEALVIRQVDIDLRPLVLNVEGLLFLLLPRPVF